ncbi:uncharacterized protein SPPG_05909 [Spizellomyces punctatus DAOM BR117]|uniref:CST complex subunit CTC1 n=1 Tax=Spizellomyces punctatus (strain DAOM BR117) TaxID=645134 RepID=A0A0L0HD97_SPIPD|nr:uncharacterized protein SPPG_05909 [Spizellomyces punctatus DAOM BR117]KNC98949.1 hypothetical protein SPPG_05909 [Spizellomyces punctatus DAOM BR117]|eukprot:XP_016606989.1 hypothetical protein SPPG_05909 [Spizellomyces punctatus DAOM BR117]
MPELHPLHHYRIYRVVELLHGNRDGAFLSSGYDGSCAESAWPLLVGQFVTKRVAEATYPQNGLSQSPAAICFCDSTGAVPCELVSFDMSWLGRDCCLKGWNVVPIFSAPKTVNERPDRDELVPLSNAVDCTYSSSYLEVTTKPYLLPANHFLTTCWSYSFTSIECDILAEASNAEGIFVSENPSRSVDENGGREKTGHKPDVQDAAEPDYNRTKSNIVSVEGVVRARSVLNIGDRQTSFFVELTCDRLLNAMGKQLTLLETGEETQIPADLQAIVTVFVLYREPKESLKDILPYYESTRIGCRYLLVGLQAAAVKFDQANGTSRKKKILLFSLSSSKMIFLDSFTSSRPTSPQKYPFRPFPLSPSSVPRASVQPACSEFSPSICQTYLLSYVGHIARILDVGAGIYELDGKNLLYTTFYYLPGSGRGFRVGAQIELHNVHMVVGNVHLPRLPYDSDTGQPKQAIFLACPCSTLTIRAFSTSNIPCFVCPIKQRTDILEKLRGFNVPDMLLFKKLQKHLRSLTFAGAIDSLEGIVGDLQWSRAQVINLLMQFGYTPFEPSLQNILLNHGDNCRLANWRYPIPDVVSIAHLREAPEVVEFVAKTSYQRTMGWGYRRFDQVELKMERSWLIGWLVGDDTGNLQLRDRSGKILVVVDSGNRIIDVDDLGQLWAIKNFHLVVETFGPSTPVKVYLNICLSTAHCIGQPSSHGATSPRETFAPTDMLFVWHHSPLPTAHISTDGGVVPTVVIQGASFQVAMDRLKCCRTTYVEFSNCGSVITKALSPDQVYLIRDAENVDQDQENVGATFNTPLYLRFAKGTRLKKAVVGNATTCHADTASDGVHPSFSLPDSDIEQLNRARYSETYRSVGALVSRHLDMHGDPDDLCDYLVCMEGIIQLKELREAAPDEVINLRLALELFEKHTIGTARHDRILFLRVQDPETFDTIDVYLDLRRHTFPLGLLPGSFVRFRKLAIRLSNNGSIYGQSIAETSISISNQSKVAHALPESSHPKVLFKLAAFWGGVTAHRAYMHVKCTITCILEVSLWYACLLCRSKIVSQSCPNECAQMHHSLHGKARIFVEDGTSEALLLVDDVDTVLALLQAKSGKLRGQLETVIRRTGEETFVANPPWLAEAGAEEPNHVMKDRTNGIQSHQGSLGPSDDSVDDLFRSCCKRPELLRAVILRCKRVSKRGGATKSFNEQNDLRRRTFKSSDGVHLPTVAQARLIIQATDLEEVDAKAEAARLLALLTCG